MSETFEQGVSLDTLQRVNVACKAAQFESWEFVASMCRDGAVVAVDFSERRPASFVKEFASLIRLSGLKLDADRHLELFLGTQTSLSQLGACPLPLPLRLSELGHVDQSEAPATHLSAACRSAGISFSRRDRALCLDGRSALVLDDELISRKILTAALTKNGCSVDAAAEGETAFSLLQQRRHDVIVLDVNLGGSMTGFDVCRAIRSNPTFNKVPVIFVSGYSRNDPVVRDEKDAGSAYFEKPVKPAHLRDKIMQLL